VPQVILKVFIIMLYENVFQNPELFPTQVSLYPEHSTLIPDLGKMFFTREYTQYIAGLYFSLLLLPACQSCPSVFLGSLAWQFDT
jgi:hypothetical protein